MWSEFVYAAGLVRAEVMNLIQKKKLLRFPSAYVNPRGVTGCPAILVTTQSLRGVMPIGGSGTECCSPVSMFVWKSRRSEGCNDFECTKS